MHSRRNGEFLAIDGTVAEGGITTNGKNSDF
jgi:hypothetical protein